MDWTAITQLITATCRDTFGEAVQYHTHTGYTINIRGIFDATYQAVDPNTGVVMTQVHPVLGVRVADLLEAPRQDDTLTVRTVQYKVKEVQADGQGMAVLLLHKVPV